jgi:hypothetical protein
MRLKSHIIFTLLFGLSTVLFIDTAIHVLEIEGDFIVEHSHVSNDDHSSVPELVEENVVQEYIIPEETNGEYSMQIKSKAIHVDLFESLYEQGAPVPPPDLS